MDIVCFAIDLSGTVRVVESGEPHTYEYLSHFHPSTYSMDKLLTLEL